MSEYMDENGLAALGPLDSDDISLRQALATFLNEDPNEGGRSITDFINDEGEKYQKLESKNFTKSLTFIVAAIFLSIVSQGISKIYPLASLIMFLLALLFIGLCFVPRLRMQSFQYGNNPKEALALPHTTMKRLISFLRHCKTSLRRKLIIIRFGERSVSLSITSSFSASYATCFFPSIAIFAVSFCVTQPRYAPPKASSYGALILT
jgi:hypothetical protein